MAQVGVDIGSFVFDKTVKTITFTGVAFNSLNEIQAIVDSGAANGAAVDIFNPARGTTRSGVLTVGGTVLTLNHDTNTADYTDDPLGKRLIICANPSGYSNKSQLVSDFALEVAKGKVVGHTSPILAASNVDLDIGTETIWKHTGLWTPMPTPSTISLVSDDSNDTVLGSGARTILVTGVDGAGAAQLEIVDLNGTTPVVTTSVWGGINPSLVVAAGVATFNTGNVTFTDTTGGGVQTIIGVADSLSNALIYHVPVGSTYYLKQLRASLFKGSGADAIVVVNGYVLTSDGVRLNIYEEDVDESTMALDTLNLNEYSSIEGGSVFYFEGTSNKNGVTLRAAFEGKLVVDGL